MLVVPSNELTQFIQYGPLRFLVAGSEAVTLFFVLSGFVLSLPFYKQNRVIYSHFLYKRFLRIYFPYYVSFVIALFLSTVAYRGEIISLSKWFNGSWNSHYDLSLLLQHLLLIDSFSNSSINPVLWSLVHEMRISIIFPFLMLLIIRLSWKYNIFLAIVFSCIGFSMYLLFKKPPQDYFQTLHYASIFIFGALLAKHRTYLIKYIRKFTFKKKLIVLFLGLFLYLYAKPAFALKLILGDRDAFLATILDSWVVSLGAGILIMISLCSGKISKFLLLLPIHYLGKISYSLYLYHCICLMTFIHIFYGEIPLWSIWFLALSVSIIVSSFSYYLIEVPSIRLGRKVKKEKITIRNNLEKRNAI